MFYYLCKFLYVGDTSRHSANIPDEVGYMCIIESDYNDLDRIATYKLKEHWEIQELLEENDCETISLEDITQEDLIEYSDLEHIVINQKDI
jgi:hypothetical protein